MKPEEQPAACTLPAGEQVGRRERWQRLADAALTAKRATENGVELRYGAAPEVLSELTDLAGLEKECCGFAAWKVSEAGEEVVLRVETESAKAPAVWAMFEEGPP